MIKSKLLIDTSSWKDVLAKNKAVKDNGLLKTLGEIKGLGEGDHDDAQKILDEVLKLSTQLKKSKEAAANPAVTKFLAELASAADTAQKDVAKAKAEADKKGKADAEAKKREEAKGGAEEGEEEEEEASALLTTKMIPLLREINKGGHTMHVLIASTGKQVVVLISKKPISPARRKLLADELGVSGGIKYIVGHCMKEEGMTTFALKTQVAGMAKRLKIALLQQTGLRVKVRCRGEDGELDDDAEEHDYAAAEGEDGDGGPVGLRRPGGDDADADKPRGNGRPAAKVDGGDEASGGEADEGGDAPVPEAGPRKAKGLELADTPKLWKGTRDLLQNKIESFRKAVQTQLADEDGDFVDEVNGNLEKLDRILVKLDKRLTNTLTNASETDDPGRRNQSLSEAKGIIAEYIQYVRSEPLIDHLDNNPFGVKTNLKATLSASLTQVARSIS